MTDSGIPAHTQSKRPIYVAGHNGMVGAAIVRRLGACGHEDILTRTHAELDLGEQAAVDAFFAAERPGLVYLAAAKVGGIWANNAYPAEFLYRNLTIEANVIHAAYRHGVERLLFLGSSCIYPRLAEQPMAESALLTGTLEPTNEPYAIAKIAGIKLCEFLEAIRILGLEKKTRFYQASTSELYGKVQEIPQTETTPFYPRSPYAVAKLYAYWITVNYREAYGIYACNGVLFNHESPIRGETFVTRKITRALARIKLGMQERLYLGNLDAKRDWGHAKDYVRMQWLMLQQEEPEDFVIATGEQHSVREFVEVAAREVGIEVHWEGAGVQEEGYDAATGNRIVAVDPRYFRPTEVESLLGDPTKAREKLGWVPRIAFADLVREMMREDLKEAERDALCSREGYRVLDRNE